MRFHKSILAFGLSIGDSELYTLCFMYESQRLPNLPEGTLPAFLLPKSNLLYLCAVV